MFRGLFNKFRKMLASLSKRRIFNNKCLIFLALTIIIILLVVSNGNVSPKKELMIGQDEPEKVESQLPDNSLLLVIAIFTKPIDFEIRRNIRESWLKAITKGSSRTKYLFCMGTVPSYLSESVRHESLDYKDLLILPGVEANEEMGEALTWFAHAQAIYPTAKYFGKVSQSAFVRINLIERYLSNLDNDRLYMGKLVEVGSNYWADKGGEGPQRIESATGFKYADGMSYILGHKLVKWMATADVPKKYFWAPDGRADLTVGFWFHKGQQPVNFVNHIGFLQTESEQANVPKDEIMVISGISGFEAFQALLNRYMPEFYEQQTKKPLYEYASSNFPVTAITAFYDIKRPGRDFNLYLSWLEKTLRSLNVPVVAFCLPEHYETVSQMRKGLPYPLKVVSAPLDKIPYAKYSERITNSLLTEHSRTAVQHRDRIEGNNPWYNVVIYSKFEWMKTVIEENAYRSKYFIWIDAGVSRFTYNHGNIVPWPCHSRLTEYFPRDKILIELHDSTLRTQNWDFSGRSSINMLAAGAFGGEADIVLRLGEAAHKVFLDMLGRDELNNEQIAMQIVYHQHPDWFNLYDMPQGKGPLPIVENLLTC